MRRKKIFANVSITPSLWSPDKNGSSVMPGVGTATSSCRYEFNHLQTSQPYNCRRISTLLCSKCKQQCCNLHIRYCLLAAGLKTSCSTELGARPEIRYWKILMISEIRMVLWNIHIQYQHLHCNGWLRWSR